VLRGRGIVCGLVAGLVLFSAAIARPDDPVTVTISGGAPDTPIPVGSSFNLAGTASSATEAVQAVVVRTGSPGLFSSGEQRSCTDLARRLVTKSLAQATQDPGLTTAKTVFTASSSATGALPALVTGAWTRGDRTDEQTYKLSVPAQGDFFQPGYSYCLFVLENRHKLDGAAVANLVVKLGSDLARCDPRANPGCVDGLLKAFDKDLARTIDVPGVTAPADLKTAARAVVGLAVDFENGQQTVARSPSRLLDREPGAPGDPPTPSRAIAKDDLAALLASRLAKVPGGLLPQVRSSRLALFTTDAAFEVTHLQLMADGLRLRVAGSAAPRKGTFSTLTATTSDVTVVDGATVHDLLLLGEQRVMIGKQELSFHDFAVLIGQLRLTDQWTDDQKAFLADATRVFAALTDATAGPVPGFSDAENGHLAGWLAARNVDHGAVDQISKALNKMWNTRDTWDRKQSALLLTTKSRETTAVVSTQIGFDQKTWLFSYVTPVVGYAELRYSFSVFYMALQLHFWPNPTNEPMWTHGMRDFRRFFALEGGIAPTGSSFGPDNRYSGPGPIPPLFLGIAVHPIPYTSVTAGEALFEVRNSTLPAEKAHFDHALFIGLNVQVNIPDLIRQLATPTTTATVENR
jgi:hypothetical protein